MDALVGCNYEHHIINDEMVFTNFLRGYYELMGVKFFINHFKTIDSDYLKCQKRPPFMVNRLLSYFLELIEADKVKNDKMVQ